MYEDRYERTLRRRLGIGKAQARALIAAGYRRARQVRLAQDAELLDVQGVGAATLDAIRGRKGG